MKGYVLVVVFGIGLISCGGNSGLGQKDVMDLPQGTATGNALSGVYEIELYAKDCKGKCRISYMGTTVSYCDIGDKENDTVDVTQTEGRIQIDIDPGDFLVTRLEGGINTDGSFLIGGYATHFGGQGEVATLAQGSISTEGVFQGEIEAHLWGSAEGHSIDCTQIYDLSGSRLFDLPD